MNNSQHTEHGKNEWYRPVNPNEHVYTPGYGFRHRPPSMIELDLIKRYCAIMVTAIICFFLISPLLTQLCMEFFSTVFPLFSYPVLLEPMQQLSMLLGAVGALTLPFLIAAANIKIPSCNALPFKAVPAATVLSALGVCLGVSVVGMYANMALDNLLYAVGLNFYSPMEIPPTNPVALAFYIINSVAIPAVLEEAAFRGVVLQSLRRFGDSFALVVSSVLFALAHPNPVSMPNAFLLGLAIGYFVLFTGSLHTGMIIHFVNNALSLLVSQLGNPDGIFSQLEHNAGEIIFLGIEILYLLVALVSIIWLLTHYENMFALSHSNTVNRAGAKIRSFFLSAPFALFLVAVALRTGAMLL